MSVVGPRNTVLGVREAGPESSRRDRDLAFRISVRKSAGHRFAIRLIRVGQKPETASRLLRTKGRRSGPATFPAAPIQTVKRHKSTRVFTPVPIVLFESRMHRTTFSCMIRGWQSNLSPTPQAAIAFTGRIAFRADP